MRDVLTMRLVRGRSEDSPREPSEAAWVQRALAGDRAAWDALIARHHRKVVVALLARGVRMDRAQELAQEAWTRLYAQQQRGGLTELRLPAIAITQATFLLLDELRGDRRTGATSPLDELPESAQPPDPAALADVRVLSREQLERAHAALAACSPSARRVFELVYEHPEWPHAVVAEQVGLSLQRVRQILCEVRAKVRARLEEEDR